MIIPGVVATRHYTFQGISATASGSIPTITITTVAGSAVGGSAAHRYWGIRINTSGGGAFALGDLELYHSQDGGNLAFGKTGFQDSGLTNSGSSQTPGTHLTDGAFGANIGNWGITTSATGTKIWVDLTTAQAINVVRIVGLETAFVTSLPLTFDVISSDDQVTWNTVWSVTTAAWASENFELRAFPQSGAPTYTGSPWGTHAYWRLLMLGNAASNGFAIAEAEFRATPGGSNQTTGGTASDSDHFSSSFVGSKAFDNDLTTMWVTVGDSNTPPTGDHWLQYQFASPVHVGEIKITARNDTFFTQSPTQFMVQYSDDGTTFQNAWKADTSSTYTGASSTITFTDPFYV